MLSWWFIVHVLWQSLDTSRYMTSVQVSLHCIVLSQWLSCNEYNSNIFLSRGLNIRTYSFCHRIRALLLSWLPRFVLSVSNDLVILSHWIFFGGGGRESNIHSIRSRSFRCVAVAICNTTVHHYPFGIKF